MGLLDIFGGDSSSSSSSSTTSNAGANEVGNTSQGSTALGLSASGNSQVTLNQESPAAIMALQKTTADALQAVSGVASGAESLAASTTNKALTTASNATQPQSVTAFKYLTWIFGFAALAGLGIVYSIFGGKRERAAKSN